MRRHKSILPPITPNPYLGPQTPEEDKRLLFGCIASLGLIVGSVLGVSLVGGGMYPSVRDFEPNSLVAFAFACPAGLGLAAFALRRIDDSEVLGVLLCFGVGLLLQTVLRWPYPFPLETLVRSDVANSFYTPSLQYGFVEFLQQTKNGLEALPLHVRGNMPGKVSLYIAFGRLTQSTEVMGYLVMAVSNLGGVLLYLIGRMIADRRTGLFALLLYLFLPSKLFFFPLLNTVSAVPVLLCFWFHLRFLRGRTVADAVLLGVGLYGALFFDPLALAMGPLFAAFSLRSLRRGEISVTDVARQIGWTVTGFSAVYAVFLLGTGYEIFSHLGVVIADASAFNRSAGRPYGAYLMRNPFEFASGLGVAQLVIYCATLVGAFRSVGATRLIRRLGPPDRVVAASIFAVFLFLDLLGVNRGEVLRLWIFLGSFVPLVSALYLARAASAWPFAVVLSSTMLEVAIPLGMLGFVIPFDQLSPVP